MFKKETLKNIKTHTNQCTLNIRTVHNLTQTINKHYNKHANPWKDQTMTTKKKSNKTLPKYTSTVIRHNLLTFKL